MEILLNYNAEPNVQDAPECGSNTPLHIAAEKNGGMLEILELLKRDGGDPTIPNKQKFTCLHISCRNGNLEMTKYLLSIGLDPNARDAYGYSAAYWAKENDHSDLCAILPPPMKTSPTEFFNYMS